MKNLMNLNAFVDDCKEIEEQIVVELRELFPLEVVRDDEGDIPDCIGDCETILLGRVGSNAADFENCTLSEIFKIVEILNEMWKIIE